MYASISVTNNMPCLPAIAIDDKANAKILTSPNKIFIFDNGLVRIRKISLRRWSKFGHK